MDAHVVPALSSNTNMYPLTTLLVCFLLSLMMKDRMRSARHCVRSLRAASAFAHGTAGKSRSWVRRRTMSLTVRPGCCSSGRRRCALPRMAGRPWRCTCKGLEHMSLSGLTPKQRKAAQPEAFPAFSLLPAICPTSLRPRCSRQALSCALAMLVAAPFAATMPKSDTRAARESGASGVFRTWSRRGLVRLVPGLFP